MKLIALAFALLSLVASAFGQTTPAPASPGASSLPTDRHDGMAISADPYSDKARSKEKFGKASPVEAGILPVEVFMKNETNEAVRINLSTIQLEVRLGENGRQDIDWLTPEEVAVLVLHPNGTPGLPGTRRSPIPIPIHDKKIEKIADVLRPMAFDADVIPPLATIHGFLFFNLSHDMKLANRASLYVPDATRIPTNQALMFFEVSFAPETPPAVQPSPQ
jgi:hypothetical protein